MYIKDLVSLVTPGWNGKNFVHRLLDSILEQTYRPIEYIYVDDGSTDGTTDIISSYKEKFEKANITFKLIRRENGGICEALMTGFQHVTGEYMSCPEYDDILLPNSVEEKVRYLKKHPDCAVVVADAWIVNENDINLRIELISHKNPNRFDRNHFYQCLMSNTIFNAACYMVRMKDFDLTHPNRKILSSRSAPNQQILLPLYYHYNRGFLDYPLSLYMIRNGSLSTSNHSYEKKILALNEYKRIIMGTLQQINMSPNDYELYSKRVEINFNKDYIELGFKNNDKSLFYSAFTYLSNEQELNSTHQFYYSIISNSYKYKLYFSYKKLRKNISKLIQFLYKLKSIKLDS